MHVEQLNAQDGTLEDMDRQGRAMQAQAETALQNLKEVRPLFTLLQPCPAILRLI